MSGIAGLYRLDGGRVGADTVEEMDNRIAHRGPDDRGVWRGGAVGLVHRMSWTTPESLHESQPARNGAHVITADARIDNRAELMTELEVPGKDAETVTDSQLILTAYDRWGERCPETLVGAFAFAIWDERNGRLFCARDHLGIRPFYYHRSDRLLAFGSEIGPLFVPEEVPRRRNRIRIGEHLASVHEDKTNTFYHDVSRLPPAHSITIGPEDCSMRTYWSLDPSRELRLGSDREYAERFHDLFTEAVRCRLRSAGPVGSTLSGGLDSSSITVVAATRLKSERLRTFSAVFDAVPECDERGYIDPVLDRYDLDAHFVHADRVSPLAVDDAIRDPAGPAGVPTLFIHRELCRSANAEDVRVLLHGFGGDSTVTYGLTRLPQLARNGRFGRLATETTALAARFDASLRDTIRNNVIGPMVPPRVRRIRRWIYRGGREVKNDIPPIVDDEFGRRIGLADRLRQFEGDSPSLREFTRRQHYRDLTSGFLPFALEMSDRTAAAHSVVPRYPFLDKRLIEFCLALPPEQFLHRGWTRMVLRRAMSSLLPETVRWRVWKTDLAPAFIEGLLTFERDRLESIVSEDSSAIDEYVDIPTLRNRHRRFVSEPTVADARLLWNIVTLSRWLRRTRPNKTN